VKIIILARYARAAIRRLEAFYIALGYTLISLENIIIIIIIISTDNVSLIQSDHDVIRWRNGLDNIRKSSVRSCILAIYIGPSSVC